jgi:hypothetical protein
MFDGITQKLKTEIHVVRCLIKSSKLLQEICFNQDCQTSRDLAEQDVYLKELLQELPDIPRAWQTHDYCSAIIRLYAVYEIFVEALITEWLSLLPSLVTRYADLDETIKRTHREGVGQLLCRPRYFGRSLEIDEIIRGLAQGVNNSENYQLLPKEAFFTQGQNLRKEALAEIFKNAGIKDSWNWLENHPDIQHFLSEISLNSSTPLGNQLEQFILARNDAAHGQPENVSGIEILLDLCNLVESLCQALVELVQWKVICQQHQSGLRVKVGRVSNWLSRIGVAHITVHEDTNLSVGDTLYLVNSKNTFCRITTIETIRLNDEDKQNIYFSKQGKVHVKFRNVNVRKNWLIYRVLI